MGARAAAAGACALLAACPPPEARLQEAVQEMERLPPAVRVEGAGDFRVQRLRLSRPSPEVQRDGAVVRARVEAEGPLGGVYVRYIGAEAIPFARDGQRYAPAPPALPRAAGILASLAARARALAAGDFDAYLALASAGARATLDAQLRSVLAGKPVHLEVRAWTVRAERDEAEAREEYRLDDAGRPVAAAALFKLVHEGGAWKLSDVGL